MDVYLSESHQEFRRRIREFAEAEIAPVTRELDETSTFPWENIRKMAATGKLIVAGPFMDGGDVRGLYIFSGGSIDEVKAMVADDPAVKAGRLVVEVKPWMAAKGIKVDPPK